MIFGADVRVALPSVPLALVLELLEQFAYFLVHIREDIPCGIFWSLSLSGLRRARLVMQELASELPRIPHTRTSQNTSSPKVGE
jgi:hypothetical protein